MKPFSNAPASPGFRLGDASCIKVCAFTLVELLAAIGIIVILAALLLPVLSSIQERSRAAKCTSNLRQVYLAMLGFANDRNGLIVRGMGAAGDDYTLWSDGLSAYLGIKYSSPGTRPNSVFACPSSQALCVLGARSDYADNFFVNGALAADGSNGNYRLASLKQPSRIIFLIDSVSSGGTCNRSISEFPVPSNSGVAFRHGGGDLANGIANAMFFDGHAAGLTRKTVPLDSEAWAYLPWNPNPRQ